MLFLYNTASKKKEKFSPINADFPKMYVCGPTVYSSAHLGNARPVIVFDVLYRYFLQKYKNVKYVRNITDIDDKIYKASIENGIDIKKLTEETTAKFHDDMENINALPPTIEPRATDHIGEMISMITSLIDRGYAYKTDDGHVFFETSKYENYGKLSNRSTEDQKNNVRIENKESKKNASDFVLWKPSENPIPGWDSPFGFGRPGWHIECSAMSDKYLGTPFDIHGGGIDLVFPHHENEIAQSCCAVDSINMANIWMHNGHLTVNGEKMSKSTGNILLVNDLLKKYSGEIIRLVILKTNYRQVLDWKDEIIIEAKNQIEKAINIIHEFQDIKIDEDDNSFDEDIIKSIEDDLNTSLAITILFKKLRESKGNELKIKKLINTSQKILGLFLNIEKKKTLLSDGEINNKINERNLARKNKDFQKSDLIRDELDDMGIVIKDTENGTIWSVK